MSPKLRPLIPFGIFLGSLAVGYVALAWGAPTATPPGNNVASPINISGNNQYKQGTLEIGDTNTSTSFPLKVVGVGGTDTSYLYVDNTSQFVGNTAVGSSGGSTNLCLNGSCITSSTSYNVGIGTTSPSYKLNVMGPSNNWAIVANYNGGASGGYGVYGYGSVYGIYGDSALYGVLGYSHTAGYPGVYGYGFGDSSGGGYGGQFYGKNNGIGLLAQNLNGSSLKKDMRVDVSFDSTKASGNDIFAGLIIVYSSAVPMNPSAMPMRPPR